MRQPALRADQEIIDESTIMNMCHQCGVYFAESRQECPCCNRSPLPNGEPEEHIQAALYLLHLCQQDLNMNRLTTVWARAKQAHEHLASLEKQTYDWTGAKQMKVASRDSSTQANATAQTPTDSGTKNHE